MQKSLTDINSTLETKIEKNFKDIEDTKRNLDKLKEQDGSELKRLSMLLNDVESGVALKSQQIEEIQSKNLHIDSSLQDMVSETRHISDKMNSYTTKSDLEQVKRDIPPKQDIELLKRSLDGVKSDIGGVREDIGITKSKLEEEQKKLMAMIESKLKDELQEKMKQQIAGQIALMPKAAPVAEAAPAVAEEKKKPKKKMMVVEDAFQQEEVVDFGSPEDQVEEVQVVSSNAKAKAQAVSSAPPKKTEQKE